VVRVLRAPWPFGLGTTSRVWVTSGKKRVVGVLRAPWPFGLGIRVWVTRGKERVVRVLRASWPFGLGTRVWEMHESVGTESIYIGTQTPILIFR
jgi:hypothetical protein